MPVSIVELGNSLRCPKSDCGEFGRVLKMKVTNDKVTLDMVCDKHQKKYTRVYSINQFVRMIDNALIDKEWIITFQKHMMLLRGEFIKLPNGLDGAYFTKNPKLINEEGKKLVCDCNSFASTTLVKIKGDKAQLNLYCGECMPKGKKMWLPIKVIVELTQAGLIDNSILQKIKDEFSDEEEYFDVTSAYSVGKGIMAEWVQESLGMMDEGGGIKKCYICGTTVSSGAERCPKCGSDL